MQLDQPVELLRELEELSSLDFKVRHTAPDNLILDVDEDSGPSSAPPSAGRTRDKLRKPIWGCSSAGRASRWQREGQGFEPPQLHFSTIRLSAADD